MKIIEAIFTSPANLSHNCRTPRMEIVECVLLHLLVGDLHDKDPDLSVPVHQLLLLGVHRVLALAALAYHFPNIGVHWTGGGTLGAFDTLLHSITPDVRVDTTFFLVSLEPTWCPGRRYIDT